MSRAWGLYSYIIGSLLVTVIGFVVYATSDKIVDLLVDEIMCKIDKNNYLTEYISEGRFVATDSENFANENTVRSDILSVLAEGGYVDSNMLNSLTEKVRELESTLETTRSIQKAESDGRIQVDLYVSEKDEERGLVVLNRGNPVVAHWIRHNAHYDVTVLFTNRTLQLKETLIKSWRCFDNSCCMISVPFLHSASQRHRSISSEADHDASAEFFRYGLRSEEEENAQGTLSGRNE